MLFKKMIRDISKHKTQFLSIFLMAFIGVFVFTGINGECAGLENNLNAYYEDTNLADGWIYSPYLNDMFLEQVNALGATTEMERQLVVSSVAEFENDPEITLHFVENNTISKFYLLEGDELDINDENGVWLDKSFADAKGLEVGDEISFESEGYTIEKVIRGLGYSPEYVYHASAYSITPDHNKIGFAYLSHKAFPEESVPYNVLNVKFKGESDNFKDILSYHLNGYFTSFIDRSNHPSVHQLSQEIVKHKMMTDIFPVVFIAITLLILLTTMTRIITHQRTQIGILKANGFKNHTIMLHYISYGFWLVLAGSLLGLILGPMMLPHLFYPSMTRSYKMPFWDPAWTVNFAIIVVLMLILSVTVSYYAVSSISNESPSNSLRPKAPKVSSSGFVERLKIWKRLSFNIRWNYRDAKRNKVRGLMTIIGVMGCSALLVGAFGLYDGLNDIRDWEYNIINHYDSKLVIEDNATALQIDEAASEVNGTEIMEKSVEIESENMTKSATLRVLDHTDLITPTDAGKKRMEISDDEVSISKKTADMLEVGVGDSVRWHIANSDKWVETKIDKIHADPLSQGIIISKDKLDELDLNYTPTSIITSEHVNGSYEGIKTVSSLKDIEKSWDKISETSWILIYTLSFFACVLSIIVIYNLEMLSFTEIEREIATLKVLGYKSRNLRRLLLTQNLAFTAVGFVLGIPLGMYILTIMWQSSGDSLFIIPRLTVANVVLTAAITFTLSILVNLLFSRKIKNLDMVESLKNTE